MGVLFVAVVAAVFLRDGWTSDALQKVMFRLSSPHSPTDNAARYSPSLGIILILVCALVGFVQLFNMYMSRQLEKNKLVSIFLTNWIILLVPDQQAWDGFKKECVLILC